MLRARYLAPLIVFVALVGFLGYGLTRDPSRVPSPLIGQSVPAFELPRLASDDTISPGDLHGQVYLLNVWASWCVACRTEHPVLMEAASREGVQVLGLDYKDKTDDAHDWLAERGNPYFATAVDAKGRVGIDLGVYGVPETYVIDADGVIRDKVVGPISRKKLNNKLAPLIHRLQQQAQQG